MSLATKVLIGFAFGIGSGIFFGEMIAPVGVLGDVFIGSLQMTVLPYVVVSLVLGLGRLISREVKLLIRRAGMLLLAIWAVALTFVLIMPLAYPNWESASYFSTTLVEPTPEINIVSLFIPANPFNSLAFGKVPSIVLFSIALGAGLMGISAKQPILNALDVVSKTLSRMAQFIVRLAPFGVFAITARASGTIDFYQFEALQVYLATYIVLWVVMGFWFLPGLATTLTRLSYRETMGPARDAFVTAFACGSVFVVLPILAEHSKNLVRRCTSDSSKAADAVDVLIPLAFTFPGPGTLFILGFVLFSGWLAGAPVIPEQLPLFLGAGILSLFGSTMVAVPFLLDLLHIPHDLFQLYVVSDVFTGRFGMLISAIFTLIWSTIGVCAIAGVLRIRWLRLVRLGVVTMVLAGVGVLGVHTLFTYVVPHEYTGRQGILDRDLLAPRVEETFLNADGLKAPAGDFGSALDRVQSRRVLRVGYREDELPFSFRNTDGTLVGHDIDLAHTLARDLGARLEFVCIKDSQMAEMLSSGAIDVVMSGVVVAPERAMEATFTHPYMDETQAFIVPDHRRSEFLKSRTVRSLKGLVVAVPDVPHLSEKVSAYLNDPKIMVIESPRQFFERTDVPYDALVFSAEAGSAWTLLHPEYSVVVPQPDIFRAPVAFAVASRDDRMRVFLNTWIDLKRLNNTLTRLYDYWILGKTGDIDHPRWSVIRDVLHWVD